MQHKDMHGVPHPLHPIDLRALLDLIHARMTGATPPPRNLPPDNGVGRGRALLPGTFIDPLHPLELMDDAVYRPGVMPGYGFTPERTPKKKRNI